MNLRWSRFRVAALLGVAMAAANAQVTVDDPWVRGVVAGQSATGAFMTIHSTEAAELVGVSSPAASKASIHRMAMANAMMTMEPVDALPIPAHGTVELKPGTFHVMLIGLTRPLEAGTTVPLTLTFRGADYRETSLTVQAEVRGVTGAASGSRN